MAKEINNSRKVLESLPEFHFTVTEVEIGQVFFHLKKKSSKFIDSKHAFFFHQQFYNNNF